jgi:hypothetical protein
MHRTPMCGYNFPMHPELNDQLPEALSSVRSRALFVLRLDVQPYQVVGPTPGFVRRIGVVPAGVFEGERLSGVVLEGGADWQTVRPDGVTTLDVRLVLKTTDGALIAMTYRGLRHGPADVMARLDQHQQVDPGSYYFRTDARFETAAESYGWINRIVAVGIGQRMPAGVTYSLFELL